MFLKSEKNVKYIFSNTDVACTERQRNNSNMVHGSSVPM